MLLHLANDRGLPATDGILNFGRIDDHLYRGAQPDAAGIARLKQIGVTTIINLRMSKEIWSVEGGGRIEQFDHLHQHSPGGDGPADAGRHGADLVGHQQRTGPGVCALRTRLRPHGDGRRVLSHPARWLGAKAAMKEADRYGLSILERGMREYVSDFAQQQPKQAAASAKN